MPNSIVTPPITLPANCLPDLHDGNGACIKGTSCIVLLDDEGNAGPAIAVSGTHAEIMASEPAAGEPMTSEPMASEPGASLESAPANLVADGVAAPHRLRNTQRVQILLQDTDPLTPNVRARLLRFRGAELVTTPLYLDVTPAQSVTLTVGELFQLQQSGVPCAIYLILAESESLMPGTLDQVQEFLAAGRTPVAFFVE